MDAPPQELHQRLGIRVVSELLTDGQLGDQIVLEEWLDAAEAADSEIWLTFQAEAAGLGGALLDAMSDVPWLPVLSVDGEATAGTTIPISSSGDTGDSLFGDGGFFGGEAGPELASLRIELISEAPGSEPLVAERILLDRVDPADRASGTVLPELLDPMPPAGEVLPALAGVHQLLVSNGAADLRAWAVKRAIAIGWAATFVNQPEQADGLDLHDLFYPLAVANQSIVLASEQLLTGGIGVPDAARAFVGRPRGYLVSFVPYPEVPDGTAIITDLALDDVDVVTSDQAPDGTAARIRLWQGVLQTALETELSLERAAAVDPSTAAVSSVSLAMSGPPALIQPSDAGSVPPAAGALHRALAANQLALLVDTDGSSFWAVDPITGRTRSVSDPGVRPGFIGGGNYVNSSGGGPRYVVDPATGNNMGTIQNGKFTPANRTPPSRCSGGTEYVVVLGCVSIPASMTVGMVTGVLITAMVSWAIVLLELLL